MNDRDAYTELRGDNERRMEALEETGIMVHPQVLEATRLSCSIDHLVAALLDDRQKDQMDLDYAGKVSTLLDQAEKEAERVRVAMVMEKFGIPPEQATGPHPMAGGIQR